MIIQRLYNRTSVMLWVFMVIGLLTAPSTELVSPVGRILAFGLISLIWYPICGAGLWVLSIGRKVVTR